MAALAIARMPQPNLATPCDTLYSRAGHAGEIWRRWLEAARRREARYATALLAVAAGAPISPWSIGSVVAQFQGTGLPGRKRRLHHARRLGAAKPAGATGTGMLC
jgi:hypothetical protein